MTEIIVPIFVCVVLPVSVVLIISLTKINSENKRTNVIIKAIEANRDVDTEKLIESFQKPKKTPLELLNLRLLRGCIFTLCGLMLIIGGCVSFASAGNCSNDETAPLFLFGAISLAIGISYLIVYFISRRQIKFMDNQK